MLTRLYQWFESRVHATAPPDKGAPPAGLAAFYWHFIGEHKALFGAILVTGLGVAVVDSLIPVFIGKLVGLMAASDRAATLAAALPMLAVMALTILIGKPFMSFIDLLARNNAIVPGVTSRIRWLSHWHVVRQSWSFFQNDFAGRIANRVMQTANAVRESVVSSIRAVWYIAMYGSSALVLMALADPRLAAPTVAWFIGYIFFLRFFVPRMRSFGKASAEAHSQLMGRVVDSYSNILTVKLFARARDEDEYVRDAVDEHRQAMSAHLADHERPAPGVYGRGRRRAMGARRDRCRHRRDGAAARLADREYGRLGVVGSDRHLREPRFGAGRHADDRGAASAHRQT